LIDPERDNNAVIADHLADLLVRYHSAPDSAKLRFALTVSVEAADALIKLAFRRHPEGDDAVLTESKKLVRGYLQAAWTEAY
jgi:hypothetical protein